MQETCSIQQRLELCPGLQPFVDWCVAWLRLHAPVLDRKWTRMAEAYEAARQQALAEAEATEYLPSPPFRTTLNAVRINFDVDFRMLVE